MFVTLPYVLRVRRARARGQGQGAHARREHRGVGRAAHIGDKMHLHLQQLQHAVIVAEAQIEPQHAAGADITAPMLARPWAGQSLVVIYTSVAPAEMKMSRNSPNSPMPGPACAVRSALVACALARTLALAPPTPRGVSSGTRAVDRARCCVMIAKAATPAVRIGVIGTGCIGIEHLQNLHLLRDVARVVAIADTHESSRRAAARALRRLGDDGGVALVESYEELLAMPDVDAVIVATPNDHHLEVMGAVCKAGKHCLVEKPLSTDVAGCAVTEALADGARTAAAAAGKPPPVLWCGMEYRYIPTIARLLQEAHAGEVGTARMLTIREHRFPFLTKVRRSRRLGSRRAGGGAGRG